MKTFSAVLSSLLLATASTVSLAGSFASSEEAWSGPPVHAYQGKIPIRQFASSEEAWSGPEVKPYPGKPARNQFAVAPASQVTG